MGMGYRHIDLFSGIGGFALACRWAGIETEVFCERDKFCQRVLGKHWPGVPIVGDIRDFDGSAYTGAFILSSGDPCPIRSKASAIRQTKQPDLSGYALDVVRTSQPEWVLRENVSAPDDVHFTSALDAIGYASVIVSANASTVTAQNRERDFIVANSDPAKIYAFVNTLPVYKNAQRFIETKHQKIPAYPVLTTHACRWDARDGYIWDGSGVRVADSQERIALAGFPCDWLDGISKTQVERMTGNAIVPALAYEIIKAILQVENETVMLRP